MSPLLFMAALWVLDRWEGDVGVLTNVHGQSMDVERAGLPAEMVPGDGVEAPGGPLVPSARARGRMIERRRLRLLALARPAHLRQGAAVKRRSDHRQDHFFHKAKREGFAARSIYKLEEIDQKQRILRPGQRVLDLGCAPGSWLQYAARIVGPSGRVVGLDLKAVDVPLPPHVRTLQSNAFDTPLDALLPPGELFDVVLSDMAPSTIGHPFTDHVRSMELCHRALAVADRTLRVGGSVVCKAFEGEDIAALAVAFRARFAEMKRLKPKGTRAESVEVFFVGLGYRGPLTSVAPPPDSDPNGRG